MQKQEENNKSKDNNIDFIKKDEREMGFRKNRIQVLNPKIKKWVKIDTKKGKIISVKSDKKPYKGIRKK